MSFFTILRQADYPMPFFEGCSPSDLYPAKPFDFIVNTLLVHGGGQCF